MRKNSRAFAPCTILLMIQLVACVVIDALLLQELANSEGPEFREAYGNLAAFLMCVSMFVIFCCVSLFFEYSNVKFIFLLVITAIYTLIGIGMNQAMYYIPIVISIISFVAYLIAKRNMKQTQAEIKQAS